VSFFKVTVSGGRASLTRVLKFKRQILALVVFFSFVAGILVVAYMGHREPLVEQDEMQWAMDINRPFYSVGESPKVIKFGSNQ
jgi:cytochrome b subunit of formate dehydrogenase